MQEKEKKDERHQRLQLGHGKWKNERDKRVGKTTVGNQQQHNLWLFFSIKTFCFRPVVSLSPLSFNSFVKSKVAFLEIKQQYNNNEKGPEEWAVSRNSISNYLDILRSNSVRIWLPKRGGGSTESRDCATIIQQMMMGGLRTSFSRVEAINFHFLKNLFYVFVFN